MRMGIIVSSEFVWFFRKKENDTKLPKVKATVKWLKTLTVPRQKPIALKNGSKLPKMDKIGGVV